MRKANAEHGRRKKWFEAIAVIDHEPKYPCCCLGNGISKLELRMFFFYCSKHQNLEYPAAVLTEPSVK